jgi:metal-dependent amidase/aminoacylase/carboxypeptidase family protein
VVARHAEGHVDTSQVGCVRAVADARAARPDSLDDAGRSYGTIRATVDRDMADLQDRVRRLATNLAEAQGCTAQVDFLQHVPAVNNRPEWVQAALPTLERVVAHDHLVETAPTLGYDNVSVFVNRYGGLYVVLGCPRMAPRCVAGLRGGRWVRVGCGRAALRPRVR